MTIEMDCFFEIGYCIAGEGQTSQFLRAQNSLGVSGSGNSEA